MRRSIVLLAWSGLLAAPVLAQQGGGGNPQLSERVPASIAAAVNALADSARARGLPTAPMFQKAIEGGAKQAPPDRIVTAVRQVYGQLAASAEVLRTAGAAMTPDAIEAGAFAFNAGLARGDVQRIVQAAGANYPSTVTLRVAGSLAAIGVPPQDVVKLVDATMAKHGPVADLQSLPSQVQAQASRGVPPAAAAEGLARSEAHGGPDGSQGPKKSHGHANSRKP